MDELWQAHKVHAFKEKPDNYPIARRLYFGLSGAGHQASFTLMKMNQDRRSEEFDSYRQTEINRILDEI